MSTPGRIAVLEVPEGAAILSRPRAIAEAARIIAAARHARGLADDANAAAAAAVALFALADQHPGTYVIRIAEASPPSADASRPAAWCPGFVRCIATERYVPVRIRESQARGGER
jgi:hypothetical protein